MKRLGQLAKRIWNPHFLFWLMFVCALLNFGIVWVDLRLSDLALANHDAALRTTFVNKANIQMLWGFFCSAAALLNYLRAHVPREKS